MLDEPSHQVTVSRPSKEEVMKTFISLCVVAIAAVSTFAGSLPTPEKDRAAASCMRLASKMRADASMDTWQNRMRVWPCLKEAAAKSHELASMTSGKRP